jgi:hypothetical protein
MPANITCDMVGSSRSLSEIGARSNAALAHFDHHGDICSNRTTGATPSARTAFGVRQRFTVHYGPISRVFEVQRSGCNRRQTIEKIGGASRDRTDGLVVANDALSQLSYSPLRLGFRFLFYQPYSLSPRRGAQKGIFFQESLRPRFRFYTLLSIHLSIPPACWLLSSALSL